MVHWPGMFRLFWLGCISVCMQCFATRKVQLCHFIQMKNQNIETRFTQIFLYFTVFFFFPFCGGNTVTKLDPGKHLDLITPEVFSGEWDRCLKCFNQTEV